MADSSDAHAEVFANDAEEAFFSQPPEALESDWMSPPWQPTAMSPENRMGLVATVGMLVFGALASLSYSAYAAQALVEPAALGGSSLPPVDALHFDRSSADALPAGGEAVAASLLVSFAERSPLTPTSPSVVIEPAQVASEEGQLATVQAPALSGEAPAAKPHVTKVEQGKVSPRFARGGKRAERLRSGKLLRAARRAFNARDLARAEALARQAIAADLGEAGAYIVLGGVRDARGDASGAKDVFRRCTVHGRGSLVRACESLAR
ncbi:MAG: hypothetical protein OEZ06_26550 [Myxococcales bacterium]|nr:hypothetical protein [Myxococcales bacterium]